VRPSVVVCLGATAGQALLGATFRVSTQRGQWRSCEWAQHVLATAHPSSFLRITDEAERKVAFAHLVADLKVVADRLAASGPRDSSRFAKR
jgi:uracil-DNA glycosylase